MVFKKILILILILTVLGCTNTETTPEEIKDTETIAANNIPEKVITLTGENYKFILDGKESPELKVKEGDKVIIKFTNTAGLHNWILDEFNVATKQVKTGESSSVEFIAYKRGTFEYYCSVGGHRFEGMKGNLIVE